MGKSPEAMKSKENYERFQQLVFEVMRKEKEAQEAAKNQNKKK